MIEKVGRSSAKGKRYVITLEDGRRINFGQKDPKSGTYIDHGDKTKRSAYLARHLANERERELIETLTPSPALFSAYLLWSYPSDKLTTLRENVDYLNELFAEKSDK